MRPKKFVVVGTFHVPFIWNYGKYPLADDTMERSRYFCRARLSKFHNVTAASRFTDALWPILRHEKSECLRK